MTCLCSQIFIDAESFVSPLKFNSWASSLRAARLLSRFKSFIRSTIDLRQSSFSLDRAARLSMIAVTSTGAAEAAAGAEAGGCAGAGADCGGGAAGVAPGADAGVAAAAEDEWPNIADMIFPKMLIAVPPRLNR